ncbi:hypothetical protein EVAR_77363_1 [Eumeta japonica]|uniref:Uncharacterized protein n=1 Tax=Eumeta variegata TaxID=151549 RepID=A0A4C1UX83_EUMVA|nr:hypothetical protein EVAR_77363_1 [Eumeta japonica]
MHTCKEFSALESSHSLTFLLPVRLHSPSSGTSDMELDESELHEGATNFHFSITDRANCFDGVAKCYPDSAQCALNIHRLPFDKCRVMVETLLNLYFCRVQAKP